MHNAFLSTRKEGIKILPFGALLILKNMLKYIRYE